MSTLSILSLLLPLSYAVDITSVDRAVLGDLYDLYNGEGWNSDVLDDWKGIKDGIKDGGDVDPCSFSSVGCDDDGYVVELNLSWFNLEYFDADAGDGRSELTPICGLAKLEVLRMANNMLSGRLSPCMADMVKLKVVDLSWNRLEGSIASDFFSKLVNLVDLNLGVNKFLSVVPDFSSNVNLVSLDLSLNAHEDREAHMGFFSSLLETHFPTSLRNVNLERNSIEGNIPHTLCDTEMEYVDLSHNLFTGGLDHCFQGDVSKVRSLDFSKNLLNGQIPSSWSMFYLDDIDISSNLLDGTFPLCIINAASLTYIDIGENSFSGPLPLTMESSSIHTFLVYDNVFTGVIPTSYLTWPSVANLDVSNNRLEGTLDPKWTELETMRSLYVANNLLEGEVPWYYNNELREVDISWNLFTGPLPTNLTGNFLYYSFSNNHLTSTVPFSLWTMPSLRIEYGWNGPEDVACPVGTSGDYDGRPFPDGTCVGCHNTTDRKSVV